MKTKMILLAVAVAMAGPGCVTKSSALKMADHSYANGVKAERERMAVDLDACNRKVAQLKAENAAQYNLGRNDNYRLTLTEVIENLKEARGKNGKKIWAYIDSLIAAYQFSLDELQ